MGLNEIIKIGDNIKKYRKQLNLTQSQMANKLNIPRSTYANYENNTREPSNDMLEEIAKVFEIAINDLIGIKETNDISDLIENSKDKLFIENKIYIEKLNKFYELLYQTSKKSLVPFKETTEDTWNKVVEVGINNFKKCIDESTAEFLNKCLCIIELLDNYFSDDEKDKDITMKEIKSIIEQLNKNSTLIRR